VAYSPDGEWVVNGYWDINPMGIWSARTGQKLNELGTNEAGKTWSVAINPSGSLLARSGENGLQIWRIERGSERGRDDGLDTMLLKFLPNAFWGVFHLTVISWLS
jgi:WD40 repeat protein